MLRPFLLRCVVNQRSSEVNALLSWCINNPGYKNVRIEKLKSSVVPFSTIFNKFIKSRIQNICFKRNASALVRETQEDSTINPIIHNHKYAPVEALISDLDRRNRYIELLRSSEKLDKSQANQIYTDFINLIDIISGFPNSETLTLICEIWDTAFARERTNAATIELQNKLLAKRDIFIHILINTRNYRLYEKLVKPLFSKVAFNDLQDTWADTLISTFQFEKDAYGKISINKNSITRFLKNPQISIYSRRKLLSIFLEKGIIFCSGLEERYLFIRQFITFLQDLNDNHLLFIDQEYSVYQKSFRLIATPKGISLPEHIDKIKDALRSGGINDDQVIFNFITSSMVSILPFSPNNVLKYWQHKVDFFERNEVDANEVFHYKDLKSAMSALCDLNLHRSVLELYQRFPQLHNDDQIEILLRVSEESKDWKLLQKQFEDMYGKGQLPYVIHYSIVMNALAKIGAKTEVDQLFKQLNKRDLKPNASIYAALISSRLFYNDIEGAKECFSRYLEEIDHEIVDNSSSAYLYSLVFDIYFKSSDLDAAMEFLNTSSVKQENLTKPLIDSKIMSKLINFAATNYGLKEIEILRNLATKLNLTSEEVYIQLIRAYTRLDQFERADSLIYEAHIESNVPFTSAEIYKSQLRNYRFWFRVVQTIEERQLILDRVNFIIQRINDEAISFRKNQGLYNEAIKFHVTRKDLQNAELVFKAVRKKDILTEHHFIPFLKYYSRLDTFDGYSQVLELYRQMAKDRIQFSTKTYVYLMKALIHLDSQNQNGYKNSFQLLQSVFELNGLTIKESDQKPKVSTKDVFENSIDLCHIVSSYVMATTDIYHSNIDLLVHFLNQMKKILKNRLTNEFRFVIYQEMGSLYQKQGNTDLARRLVDSGMEELHQIITKFSKEYPYSDDDDVIIPKGLQLEYRRLLNLKLSCMKSTHEKHESYLHTFKEASKCNIRLSGNQYTLLIEEIMNIQDKDILPTILSICESYLVAGNWVEAKLMRKMQFLYKLMILHYSNTVGPEVALQKFDILNRFYDVKDISKIQNELSYIKEPLLYLQKQLHDYNLLFSKGKHWTIEELLSDIPEFFVPEQRISSQNKISPSLLSKIWHLVNNYCDGDNTIAFKLMDEFPETIEFLLYNGLARLRLLLFRNEIDKINPPPKSEQQEDFESRRLRSIKALEFLKTDHPSF